MVDNFENISLKFVFSVGVLLLSLEPAGAMPIPTKKIAVAECNYFIQEALSMQKQKTNYMKITEIVRLAYMNASGVVEEQSRQSLPIPVLSGESPRISFFFSPALALPKHPVKLSPPNYIISLSAKQGRFEMLRAVEPKQFGVKHTSGEHIGDFSLPDGMTVDDYIQKRNRLYDIYDLLLPEFFSHSQGSDNNVILLAQEFSQLFRILSEPPLWPYYRNIGDDFFCWVTNITTATKEK
jgi:hypothetical protein